jgi:nitrate/nitrite-specific signal transduction histidine kinase
MFEATHGGVVPAHPRGWGHTYLERPPAAMVQDISLRRLKLATIVAPLVFLVLVDVLRRRLQSDMLQSWVGDVILLGVVLFGVLLFSETVFGRIEQMQERLARQNRELLALHEAGLDVSGELALDLVLQKVVTHATDLLGAHYGALSVPSPGGGIEAFLTAGITAEQRALIGPPPVGHGLLAVVLEDGQRLRMSDLTQDPRSVGFPPHHPPMHSLLAVPIVSRGRVLGNLYLAEKQGASEFSAGDEETLVRFATQAALAIDNARLHRRVRAVAISEERDRIAREMHDSLAQVLGYVNTKAQAVQELLKRGQTERAEAQVAQLGDAARAAYADVREGILALRTSLGPGRTMVDALSEFLGAWQEQSDVHAELVVEPADASLDALPPAAELQLLRIVQEALANIRKHAAATHVEVRITAKDHEIETVIADDGRGFVAVPLADGRARPSDDRTPHFGLSTMRERAESVGGRLEIVSAASAGTRVVVRLPVAERLQ